MRNWPTDPIRQHDRIIAALCDDMASGIFSLNGPAVMRVVEINRQINEADEQPARVEDRAAQGRRGSNVPPCE